MDAAPGWEVQVAGASPEPRAIEIRASGSAAPLAVARLSDLEEADAPGYDARTRSTGLVVRSLTLAPAAPPGAWPLLAYAVGRQARVERRPVVLWPDALPPSTAALLQGSPMPFRGFVGTRTDLLLDASSRACDAAGVSLDPRWLVQEVMGHVRAFIPRIYATAFFRSVEEGTLTREQYVHAMSQTHQYVRYTTRILGQCVSGSASTELRQHFIRHLTGEVNHEIIIERDLEHLGADPAWVRDRMPANVGTQQFLLAELALIAWFRDPILLTAAPLAAEGMSAHLSKGWIDRLNAIIGSWGVANPDKGSRFLSSHIDFDSGDDGHFEGSVAMLAEHLRTEVQLGRFVSAFAACADALERCYDGSVAEMALWAAPRS